RMGVLGAGQRGAGIATAHARSGIPSVMVDVDDGRLADGMSRAQNVIASRIKIGRAEPRHMAEMLGLLNSSLSHQAFSDCDVVVEAIVENEDVKKQAYQSLAPALRDDAILATNTSTISITRLAESAPEPERFVGMHFFFPVDRMALVEVIRGEKTSDETVATIVRLAQRVRKTPIVVNDCAGFLVNRILMPYMAEAVLLLAEGASMDAIDKAATRFGMPMGPIALHDLVGIDVACFAGHVMGAAYRDRAVTGGLLDAMVAAGRLGKKSGAGFRKFVGKKSKPADDPDFAPLLAEHRVDQREHTAEEITERLFLTMLLEAVRALEEGIVSEPTHVDMGLILGIGFPPFRGGVLGWCDELGAAAVVDQAEKYAALGKRYEPSDLLRQHAQSGELFYPLPKLDTTFGGPS
ncbi:MAG: 3-hydroxyacyl-CoA dehydrogenase NAD-binding domain-containing protein, partial [Planctomycetales bacterium]